MIPSPLVLSSTYQENYRELARLQEDINEITKELIAAGETPEVKLNLPESPNEPKARPKVRRHLRYNIDQQGG